MTILHARYRVPGTILALAAALAAAGCMSAPRESRTVTKTIDLGGAETASVGLHMGAGELKVSGGATSLMDGTFTFNVPEWEPVVDYQAGTNGTLSVRQPSGGSSFGRTNNDWDVRLNDAVPIDLVADMGASEATLTLGSLNLRSLSVEQGVGELTLDLRGAPRQSYRAQVKGGVGSSRIRVPGSVGVVLTVDTGIGSVNVDGLVKRDGVWRNPGHEDDPVVVTLDVKSGVGEVRISAEPAP
jgi:N-terminal domain of toast_rack, DUF2154